MTLTLDKSDEVNKKSKDNTHIYSRTLSTLGAFGTALQNYPAVDLFMNELFKNIITAGKLSKNLAKITALGAGSMCGGLVNFWMNVELLDGFFARFKKGYHYKNLKLTAWQKLQYFGGIFVFLVTGILFGLMAFTFAMSGPLAMLSIAAGIFVAIIMTIQEIETWLSSYDNQGPTSKESLTLQQQIGKWCGHIIAVGNVLALSLLFTLSLAQALIALNVAALPAIIAGVAVAFTFGAFTEYYFYNFYLAKFCKNFSQNWKSMTEVPNAWLGFLCVTTNAFVNAALTYAGIGLLSGLLIAANIALPPVLAITILASVCAFFAGSASFILGMDFWVRQNPQKSQVQEIPVVKKVSPAVSQFGLFSANKASYTKNTPEEISACMDQSNLSIALKA